MSNEKDKKEKAASVVGSIEISNKLFSFDSFKNKKKLRKNKVKKQISSNFKRKNKNNEKINLFDINLIKPIGNGEKVDVVVIGGGPAGYKVSSQLAKNGLKVVNIEKKSFGGTCVNIGCIPVKTLIQTSKIYQSIKKANFYNIKVSSDIKIDFKNLNKRRWSVSETLAQGAKMVVKNSNAIPIIGEAKVIDKYNVKVNGEKYTTKIIIIATGSKPKIIDLPGFKNGYKENKIIDSTSALDLTKLPKNITIIGSEDKAGPTIDLNFSQIFADLGTKVTLVKQSNSLANLFDSSIQKIALESLKKSNVKVILNAKVKEYKNGSIIVDYDGKKQKISNEIILIAIGRVYLETGIEKILNLKMKNGFIDVDENFKTNIDNVFAIGDVLGKYMLAHEGFRHGIVLANYLLGKPVKYKQNLIPKTSYIIPEVAAVGKTEEELKKEKIDYLKSEWLQKFVGKSVADGKTDGNTKILIGKKYGEILGVHIANDGAINSINEATALMELEATIEEVKHMTHPHPATSESIWDAALMLYQTYKQNK